MQNEWYENILRNLQNNQRLVHKPIVCEYCKTNPVKSICVNCGAPQKFTEVSEQYEILRKFYNDEMIKFEEE